MSTTFWRNVFRIKGAWNCLASVGFVFGDDALRESFGAAPADATWRALFLALAFVFGLGYLRVSTDLTTNHDIVRMGILGQLSVFVITLYAVTLGKPPLPWPYLIGAVIDLVFALLFIAFLRRGSVDESTRVTRRSTP